MLLSFGTFANFKLCKLGKERMVRSLSISLVPSSSAAASTSGSATIVISLTQP